MAIKNKLGIFFGINALSIIETQKNNIIHCFEASHSLFESSQNYSSQNIPDEIKITAIIQKSLRDNKIEISDVGLSLPSGDIILRSFFIPWMTSSEVKGVVDFEARRYIPFKLDELAYGYHATTITEKKNRRIRILFVAVRKDILEKYLSILDQAGLRVVFAEPSILSLLRLLSFKKQIQRSKRYAVIQLNHHNGSIAIIDQGVPQFLRDFRFASSQGSFSVDAESLNARLLNEIRMSLDYYRREHSQSNVDQILYISDAESSAQAELIKENTGLPVTTVLVNRLMNNRESSLESLNAFGISLRDDVPSVVKIDLAKSLIQPQEVEEPLKEVPVNFLGTFKVAAVCAVLLLIVFLVSGAKSSRINKQNSLLKEKIGIYDALSVKDLEDKKEEELNQLESYKNVRLKSDAAFYLNRIPDLLPRGAWLTRLKVSYQDNNPTSRTRRGREKPSKIITKTTINMRGYVYTEKPNQQIQVVNDFVSSLRQEPRFQETFEKIFSANARKENLDDYAVTSFEVTCE
ncbi:MAG: pilus assembly protein PilM [Candidatus Omnitrophota bacterium]